VTIPKDTLRDWDPLMTMESWPTDTLVIDEDDEKDALMIEPVR